MNKKIILNFIFYILYLIVYIPFLVLKSSSGPVRYDWIATFYISFTIIFWLVRFILNDKLESELLISILTSFLTYLIIFIWNGYTYIDVIDLILSWGMLYIISGMYILVALMAISNCFRERINMVKKTNILLVIILLSGCIDIKDDIYELAEHNCAQKEECIIDFKDILLEDGSDLYIFNNPTKGYVQEKIGIKYDLYKDIGDKMILIKDGKIKSYYELFPSAENLDGDILFSFHYDGIYFPFYKITSADSKLKAKKRLLTDKKGKPILKYELFPLSEKQISY